MLYSPLRLNLTRPPHFPHNMTVFAHARWRFPLLSDAIARAKAIQAWADVGDFRRWERAITKKIGDADDEANGGVMWSEDPGVAAPSGCSPEEAARIGSGVWDRGYRTAHLVCRPGDYPRVAWSSYRKIFGDEAPVRLTETQEATGHMFTLLRSVDVAVLAHNATPFAKRRQTRRLVVYGLPMTVADEPPTQARLALNFWHVIRNKQRFHGWEIELRECSPHQNPAAFLSGCYAAPIVHAPVINPKLNPFAKVTLTDAAPPVAEGIDDSKARLLHNYRQALECNDTEAMSSAFAAAVNHVNLQRHGSLLSNGAADDSSTRPVAAEKRPEVLGRLMPVPEGMN